MTTIPNVKRSDLLGTAMTAARVGAAIIANERGDEDAPYVAPGMRHLGAAIDQLVQALAETRHAQDMGHSQDADQIDARLARLTADIRAAIGR